MRYSTPPSELWQEWGSRQIKEALPDLPGSPPHPILTSSRNRAGRSAPRHPGCPGSRGGGQIFPAEDPVPGSPSLSPSARPTVTSSGGLSPRAFPASLAPSASLPSTALQARRPSAPTHGLHPWGRLCPRCSLTPPSQGGLLLRRQRCCPNTPSSWTRPCPSPPLPFTSQLAAHLPPCSPGERILNRVVGVERGPPQEVCPHPNPRIL